MIMSKATGEVLERWNFSIETDNEVLDKGYFNLAPCFYSKSCTLNFIFFCTVILLVFHFPSFDLVPVCQGRRVTKKL